MEETEEEEMQDDENEEDVIASDQGKSCSDLGNFTYIDLSLLLYLSSKNIPFWTSSWMILIVYWMS